MLMRKLIIRNSPLEVIEISRNKLVSQSVACKHGKTCFTDITNIGLTSTESDCFFFKSAYKIDKIREKTL